MEDRRHGATREDLEAKDRLIAELEEQVALLSGELERKDAILSHIAEGIGELLPVPGTANSSRRIGTRDARGDKEVSQERPALPDGYRVVAVASDAWVLVSRRGLRVAGYRGELDLRKVALDAREHLRRQP